jgi:hypothetical protein
MRRSIFTALACVLVAGALLVAQPHVVDRYALYLGSPAKSAQARLYLDPFPDDASCESRVRLFATNGERAFCSGRREFEIGTATDTLLAADFKRLVPALWFCLPRFGGRSIALREPRRDVAQLGR